MINIPIKKGVATYINKLKSLGFEIVFITKRGFKDYNHSDSIISDYMKKNNIFYEDCDYFIDSAIHNCEYALEKTNAKVIIPPICLIYYFSNL